jgi:hypothetical protein
MCAPRPKMPAPPPPAPAPVPTPVADTKVPELDLAIETEGQEYAKKKKAKKLGKKSLRTDVMTSGSSGLNIPS